MKTQRGFSALEFLGVSALLAVVLAYTIPSHIRSRDESKEEETKSNLHTISIALERYAVDYGEYPSYILGGDRHGWDENSGCRAVTMPTMGYAEPPKDPLIEYNYIQDYPRNAFLIHGDGVDTIIMATGASHDPGDGDVRFGFSGEHMGNCLDDPRYLFNGPAMYNATDLRWTMYPIPGSYLGVLDSNSPNSFFCMGGIPEWTRQGISDVESGKSIGFYWPGEFFYRSGGVFDLDSGASEYQYNREYIWEWDYVILDKYMLGAYGSLRSEGLDVIRLTSREGNIASAPQFGAINGYCMGEFYQDHIDLSRDASHPDFDDRVQYSNPEVFGGGGRGLMPQFPYYDGYTCNWVFGAPDGIPDGIVLVITSELGAGVEHLEW